MLHVSNEGTSERTRENSTQDNSMLTWRTTQRVEGTTNLAMRESEVVSSEDNVVMARPQQTEGKPLVLLQVNCRKKKKNKNMDISRKNDPRNHDRSQKFHE
jgi:hypothetical protein